MGFFIKVAVVPVDSPLRVSAGYIAQATIRAHCKFHCKFYFYWSEFSKPSGLLQVTGQCSKISLLNDRSDRESFISEVFCAYLGNKHNSQHGGLVFRYLDHISGTKVMLPVPWYICASVDYSDP